jgi:hypothetical protein
MGCVWAEIIISTLNLVWATSLKGCDVKIGHLRDVHLESEELTQEGTLPQLGYNTVA